MSMTKREEDQENHIEHVEVNGNVATEKLDGIQGGGPSNQISDAQLQAVEQEFLAPPQETF